MHAVRVLRSSSLRKDGVAMVTLKQLNDQSKGCCVDYVYSGTLVSVMVPTEWVFTYKQVTKQGSAS